MLCQLSYASGMATAGMLLRVLRTAARGLPPGLFISRRVQKVKAMPPAMERSAWAKKRVLPSGVTKGQ
jgi:hypothetical protein